MTSPKELIDSFSETLLCDERILGSREKELLSNLLRRASTRDAAVNLAIAQTVGEIVAQRAYEVLGESITGRLIETGNGVGSNGNRVDTKPVRLGPAPPGPGPKPPGPGASLHLGPAPPGPGPKPPGPGASLHLGPAPPGPGPKPPGPGRTESSSVAVEDTPAVRSADCLILDEFLAPAEVNALLQFALDRESEFQVSEVVSPGVPGTAVDYEHRRSLVLMHLDPYRDLIVDRIRSCWPRILQKLEHEWFVASEVEAQITASTDGDFFRSHSDNAQDGTTAREITFVYFFHREPKKFHGGELRIYDSRCEGAGYVRADNYRAVIPEQNQLVLFNSSLEHEITLVECASREFADSRFTVNGWFHR